MTFTANNGCTFCGSDAHMTSVCPMRKAAINLGALDPQQRLDVARGQPAPAVAGMDDHFREPTEMVAGMDGWRLVPVEPTEEMWGGLARDLMMWLDFGNPTVEALRKHLRMLGVEWPAWMNAESEMQGSGVPSKGTRATLIYKAMLSAAPVPPVPAQCSYRDDPRTPSELSLAGCRCVRFGEGNPQWPCKIHPVPQPPAQVDERDAFEAAYAAQVSAAVGDSVAASAIEKYRGVDGYTDDLPFLGKAWEWFQAGAAWQRTQASPAPSADGGKVESDEVRRLREAISVALNAGRGTSGRIILEAEDEAVLRAALSAQQGEGERG